MGKVLMNGWRSAIARDVNRTAMVWARRSDGWRSTRIAPSAASTARYPAGTSTWVVLVMGSPYT